jgi:hypothetical protein
MDSQLVTEKNIILSGLTERGGFRLWPALTGIVSIKVGSLYFHPDDSNNFNIILVCSDEIGARRLACSLVIGDDTKIDLPIIAGVFSDVFNSGREGWTYAAWTAFPRDAESPLSFIDIYLYSTILKRKINFLELAHPEAFVLVLKIKTLL